MSRINVFLKTLKTREMQGAFAFFELNDKFQIENKYGNFYIDNDWYHIMGDYYERHKAFNNYFFEPFVELILWYLKESKIKNERDYYSKEEIYLLNDRFKSLELQMQKLGIGQEIIFNEEEEIKKLIKELNKKNWIELIKGKFLDMALEGVISIEGAKLLIKTLTGEKITFD